MGTKYYWTFEIDDEIYDADFKTSKECLQALDEFYAEKVREEEWDLQNGDKRSCDAKILRFAYNDNNERFFFSRLSVVVEYEHYHGDRAEHGTY